MHVTTKEVDSNGNHILTSVLEADGAFELASDKAKLEASVVSVLRTASGGIEVKLAVSVTEPVPEAPKVEVPPPSADEQAIAFLVSKGQSEEEAKGAVERFGADKILAKRDEDLKSELDALLKSEK